MNCTPAQFGRILADLWHSRWPTVERRWTVEYARDFFDLSGAGKHPEPRVRQAMRNLAADSTRDHWDVPSAEHLALALRDLALADKATAPRAEVQPPAPVDPERFRGESIGQRIARMQAARQAAIWKQT